MEYALFIISGLIIGVLLWQLMKGGKIGLVGGITIGVIGVLFGGFIFPKLGVTIGELILGAILLFLGAVLAFYVMHFMVHKRSNRF